MEITDLRVEDFSKVVHLSALTHPQLLTSISIHKTIPYPSPIQNFQVYDQNSNPYQLYVSYSKDKKYLDKVSQLKKSSKFLFLESNQLNIILQQKVEQRLDEYVKFYKEKFPYMPETEGKKIMTQVTQSVEDFINEKVGCNCISPINIIKVQGNWCLSAIAAILDVDSRNPQYYDNSLKGEEGIVYCLGTLLFELVFGFLPYDKKRKWSIRFSFGKYLEYLEAIGDKIKIYYFAEKKLSVSENFCDLIERSLSGQMKFNEWKQHLYFKEFVVENKYPNQKTKELEMVNEFGMSHCSLILSAIEYKSKHVTVQSQEEAEPKVEQNIQQKYAQNSILKYFKFGSDFEDRRENCRKQPSIENSLPLDINYFWKQKFDPDSDAPFQDLHLLISKDRENHPKLYENTNQRQYHLKLYALPYAIVFQLMKVYQSQSEEIKKKIKKACQYLLQISALHYPGKIQRLHSTNPKIKNFDEIKTIFRQTINKLYSHFMKEAMKKYNKKSQQEEKKVGLEYYRLCLKLLEGSLVVRKGGKSLDIMGIELYKRELIETKIRELLKEYFPTKTEIH